MCVCVCVATAAVSNELQTAATLDNDDNSETINMPEMSTPNISLEVSETVKDENAVVTEDQSELSPAATSASQEHDGLKKSEVESQPEEEIPVSKPQPEEEIPVPMPQPKEEIPVPKPQPEVQNSTPAPHSSLSASGDATPQLQDPKLYPKPAPVRSKPIPAPRARSTKGKLLPLREKLADNVNKLPEYPDQLDFVPTAEWVRKHVYCIHPVCFL